MPRNAEGMVRLEITLTPHYKDWVKRKAKENNMTLSQYMCRLISKEMDNAEIQKNG